MPVIIRNFVVMQKILITGASGFIGSFIAEEALRRGMETWAAVRSTSSRKYLADSRLHFLELDFSSREAMEEVLKDHEFDYVVHAAGLTKTPDKREFYRVNTDGTRRFAESVVATQRAIKRFVFLSSLSVMGAIKEHQPYEEITLADQPEPNTHYGRSKLAAEKALDAVSEQASAEGRAFPYVILRPTGVYGPREKDYMMMVDSIRRHVDFAVGYRRQDITFIYVSDLVDAVFLSLDNGVSGGRYFLSDGNVYQSADFSRCIRRQLGNPFCMRIVAPIWLLRIITAVGDIVGKLTGRVSALNGDKYHILRQRNWRCDITKARDELTYSPKVILTEGVRRMITNEIGEVSKPTRKA